MFGKRKESRQKSANNQRDLTQFGIFNVPQAGENLNDSGDDPNDSDLEAELAALSSGSHQPKKRATKPIPKPDIDLDKMVQDSLADVDTDVDSDDENDPNLLRELGEIAGDEEPPASGQLISLQTTDGEKVVATTDADVTSIINQRLEMYTAAESSAKKGGDAMRARRFQRGIKTLQDLKRQADSGKPINVDDIPPEVSVKAPKSNQIEPEPIAPTRTAPPIPKEDPKPAELSPKDKSLIALRNRQNEYKLAAVSSKKNGDKDSALKLVKVLKMIDMAIAAVEGGEVIDLGEMPPPPSDYLEMEKQQQSGEKQLPESQPIPASAPPAAVPAVEAEPVMATTIDEALIQRLEKYKSVEQAAKEEGNTSKARRFGRIIKQYEDAIKLYKAGKPVNYEELPTPPGFGPIPLSDSQKPAPSSVAPKPPPALPPRPTVPPRDDSEITAVTPPKPKPPLANRVSGNLANTTHMQRQIDDLLKRQTEFKVAAIQAKKNGDIEEAKEYLRSFKGFDKLIETARGGFPVDMTTLPIPPNRRAELEDSFEIVTSEVSLEDGDGEGELVDRLLEQLKSQLATCKSTRDHHRAMGDVPGANKFENLALSVQKDIDVMKLVKRSQTPLPKYHYEHKSFNIVKCHTDLTDNQLEISIERGINYNVTNPKDVDTYVKFEFPYPQDAATKGRTSVVKNTDNPEYQFKQVIDIQRSNKQCVRVFKRQALKLDVYADRGFLRSDQLLGTVNVKLQQLENECEIHDSFDIMQGRKAVGGKLEVKMRVRNPLLHKQIEKVDEKWLVIGS